MTQARRTRRTKTPRLVVALVGAAGVFVVAAIPAAGCGADNGLVGGECAPGFTECDRMCVDLATDVAHCGACANACPAGQACNHGTCGGSVDDSGHPIDAANDQTERFDGADLDGTIGDCDVNDPNLFHCQPIDSGRDSTGDGTTSDGSSLDGGDARAPDGSDGSVTDAPPGDACVPPFTTPDNCGACGVVCVGVSPVCGLVDGGYGCVPLCFPPLSNCLNACVNESRDPFNCGGCGIVCASGYCQNGACQGAVPGNVMLLGHDFSGTATLAQQAKLLTNTVFYNNTNAVRVFSFEHYADPSSVARVKTILQTYATSHNLALSYFVSITDTDVPSLLTAADSDVLLVYDQSSAPPGTLATLGTAWAGTMDAFTRRGGIVLVLDADQGTGEMPQFTTNGGLLTVTSHQVIAPGTPVNVTSPGTIGRGMTSVYVVDPRSAEFVVTDPAGPTLFYVVTDPGTVEFLAVHKIVP